MQASSLAEGLLLAGEGRPSEALPHFKAVLAGDPLNAAARNGIAGALQSLSRHTESLAAFAALLQTVTGPLAWRVASNYLMALHYADGITSQQLLDATASLVSRFGGASQSASGRRRADTGEPLRVGFVSPDLADHPVGLLLLPVLMFLDRRQFTPLLYATGGRPDGTAAALRRYAAWHDVADLERDALLARLRADRLDVLIDLSGHTAGNRLPVFADRAAPLQLSWLGYFGTTGIAAMDCALMDPWTVAPGQERLFTEQVLRMQHSRWCYHPVGFAPQTAPPPCLTNRFITFGSFNNTAKYSEQLFSVWARVLGAVANSRLVLKAHTFADTGYREWVVRQFAAHGIGADRLDLRPRSFHRPMLEQYADVDIALDPFPFCGGYTSCEALWMGLPLVTLAGDHAVARQGLGLVAALGRSDWLRDWTSETLDSYVGNAVALAASPAGLETIRGSLRGVMKASPLMDARAFARDFEGVIVDRWRQVAVDAAERIDDR